METFLSGFAKGYIAERDRRLTRDAEKEDTMFKYKMQNLTEQKEIRSKKKLQEAEWMDNAKLAAEQLGDPEAVETFYKEFRGGNTLNQVQQRIADGYYVKNDKYVQPSQTVKVKMPAGVDPMQTGAATSEEESDPMMKKVNARIDELDPNLRKEAMATDELTSVPEESNSSKYIFKDTSKVKAGSFAEAEYAYQAAVESKDPVAIRKAKMVLDSHKNVEIFKAGQKAKSEGKAGTIYGIVDAKGNLIGQPFVGEVDTGDDGNASMYNTTDPRGRTLVPITPDQRVVTISEDQNKRRFDLLQKKREEVEKYKASVQSYGAATNNQLMLEKLVNDHPNVTFAITDLAVAAKSLEGNARAMMDLLNKQSASTQAAFQSGDADAIETSVAQFEQSMTDVLKGGLLTQAVRDEAVAKAVYNSLLTNAVYQFAAANGINGRDMSDKDVAQFKNMIAEGGADAIMTNLDNINQSVLLKIMSAEKNFGKDPAMQALMGEIGVTGMDGVSLPRVGDMLDEVNPSGQLRMKQDIIRKRIETGTMTAAQSAEGVISTPAPQDQSNIMSGRNGKKYRFLGGDRKDKRNYEEVK